jgi:hypothetical protein
MVDTGEDWSPTLTANGAKARFGIAHLRAVCSQAGVGCTETSPDEDVLAVDASVEFEPAAARVQVKCTGQFKISGGSTATWPAEVAWRDKWRKVRVPVYFVLVIVDPDDQLRWLHHHDEGTLHRAAAFWTRIDPLSQAAGIQVPKNQRLTADTLRQWAADVRACFESQTQDEDDVA